MDIGGKTVNAIFWQSIILLGANLRGEPLGEESLSCSLSQDRNGQSHICKLEGISEDVEVTGSKNEGHNGDIGNSRSSWVFPRQESSEERVVVCELLAGGSWVGRCCASSSEVGELGRGLCRLLLDICSDWAICQILGDRVVLDGTGGSRGIYKDS